MCMYWAVHVCTGRCMCVLGGTCVYRCLTISCSPFLIATFVYYYVKLPRVREVERGELGRKLANVHFSWTCNCSIRRYIVGVAADRVYMSNLVLKVQRGQ